MKHLFFAAENLRWSKKKDIKNHLTHGCRGQRDLWEPLTKEKQTLHVSTSSRGDWHCNDLMIVRGLHLFIPFDTRLFLPLSPPRLVHLRGRRRGSRPIRETTATTAKITARWRGRGERNFDWFDSVASQNEHSVAGTNCQERRKVETKGPKGKKKLWGACSVN